MKLRTRLVILVIMWLVTIALAVVALNMRAHAPSAADISNQPAAINKDTANFKTMTVAVCEKTASDSFYCHDEIKVVCGDKEYIAPKAAGQITCGNLKAEVPSVTAFAVFDKDWKDPRLT